jgi:hypothetical protein
MATNLKARTRFNAASKPDADNKAEEHQAGRQTSPASVQLQEPEDAYLTGASRSLQRRLLGLNIDGGQGKKHPETVPGQHATGSFTKVQSDELPKASGQK